ncbi:MAG TPA: dipeptidase, partial [Gemmatimonadaceae bacterium]|nr:dipeptidase [Gemmatimonadaceae bacterium]
MTDSPSKPSGVSEHAWQLYRDAIVIDTHNDMPTKVLDDGYDPDVSHTSAEGHTDLPRLLRSGITAQVFAAWVDAPYALAEPDQSFDRANALIDAIHAFVRRHPRELTLATTADDIRCAKRDGQVAILIGVEGGHAIESSLDKLRNLYARGARYLTLTWNNGNAWAGSSVGVNGTRTGGLTEFGREVIREMNRIGMLVDVSHVSDATLADVMSVSDAPVIASHSSARALSDHPRNLRDEQLRAIADTGGVVSVNFYARFLDERFAHDMAVMEETIRAESDAQRAAGDDEHLVRERASIRRTELLRAIPPIPLSVLIDHIDHIARVAGVDHVGIGSDFDGISATPAD